MDQRSEDEGRVLWLKMQGHSYREIAEIMGLNQGSVWRVINHPIKRSVYSILIGAQYR